MNFVMRFFLVLFMFLIGPCVFGQDQCSNSLRDANSAFEQGHLYDVPGLLSSCLEGGFTKEQKINAYRLLTLSYLYLDYFNEADSSYLELLKLSPEFKTNDELDPIELINHHRKFTTKPIVYVNPGKIGLNVSYANIINDFSLSTAGNGSSSYSTVLGFNFSFGAEMVIYKSLHLTADIMLSSKRIHLNDNHWDFYSTNMDIVRSEIELPILLKYNWFLGKVNPFVSGGISPAFLTNSSVQNISGSYYNEDEEFPVQPRPKINTSQFTNKFNYSFVLGAGILYKIRLDYLVFELRYAMAMLNNTKEKNRWREDFMEARDLKLPTGHVDDDYKLNSLFFHVGYIIPLYHPRKIK